jgi:hypothetical protein
MTGEQCNVVSVSSVSGMNGWSTTSVPGALNLNTKLSVNSPPHHKVNDEYEEER